MDKKKQTRKDKLKNPAITNPKVRKPINDWIPGLLVALLGFVLYSNTLNHGFALDDYSVILENRITKQGFAAIPEIFKTSYRYGYYFTDDNLYRPVVKAMFAAEWGMSPGSAKPGHWMNVLLFAFSGFILYKMLIRLSNGNSLFAFIASVLFIAHPIHTEVVANIKSRDEMMAFLFSIWALERFIYYLNSGKNVQLIISTLLFVVALLSKESAIPFLVVFPLAGWFFTSVPVKNIIMKSLPYLGAVIFFMLLRNAVLPGEIGGPVSMADNLLMSTQNSGERFATAMVIMGMYLKLLILPHPLAFDYSFNQIPVVGMGDWKFLLSTLIHLGMLVFALMNIKNRNYFSFFILFYLVTISISSNIFVIIGSSMGERFLYIPSLAFCMVVGWGIIKLLKVTSTENLRVLEILKTHKTVTVILAIILTGYSVKTVSRNPVWKNNYTLYSNDVVLSPNSTRTHYYLGNYLVKPEAWEGKSETEKRNTLYRGISELQKSIAIYPGFADAHLQMGVAYYKLNNPDSALISYQNALKINPKNATIYNNIGTIYFSKQQYSESLKYFLNAVKLDPNYAEAYGNAGSAYGMLQQYDNALSSLFQSIKCDPNFAMGYYFIGLTYRFKGDETNATGYLQKAYNLDPSLRPK